MTRQKVIMLVDDEPEVLRAITRILQQAGHEVVACSGFEEAEKQLAKGIAPDLLLTDVVLRNSTGKRVAATVQKTSPKTKVVFMSGYGNVSVGGNQPVLQKPFGRQELTDIIERALSDGAVVDSEAPFSLSRRTKTDA